jgi:hypothetical protein
MYKSARELDIHPSNLLLRISKMFGNEFVDFWPKIDGGFIETIRHINGNYINTKLSIDTAQYDQNKFSKPFVSQDAFKILGRLKSKGHWGRNNVGLDTIKNHYCHKVQNVEKAIDELVELGLILLHNDKQTYSLNPKMKLIIEEILSKSK